MKEAALARKKLQKYLQESLVCAQTMISETDIPLTQNLPGKVALSCDAWTSGNQIAFISVAGTFIDSAWNLREILFGFKELKGSHTGENLAQAIHEILKDLNLEKKVSCFDALPFSFTSDPRSSSL
jgi:hypothetical protein